MSPRRCSNKEFKASIMPKEMELKWNPIMIDDKLILLSSSFSLMTAINSSLWKGLVEIKTVWIEFFLNFLCFLRRGVKIHHKATTDKIFN